jgi:hypothetical protein
MKYDLFPTPVWHIEGTPQVLIDELYKGAYRFKKKHSSENRSNKGGYQTPAFDWEKFHPQGIEYIDKVVGDIFKFKVESWWYNINGQGHWNVPHVHAGSDLALVLYVTDSDGLLNLMSPNPMRLLDSQDYGGEGDHMRVNANKGDIIIFPSDLVHYVMPNPKEEDRISISMNLQLC